MGAWDLERKGEKTGEIMTFMEPFKTGTRDMRVEDIVDFCMMKRSAYVHAKHYNRKLSNTREIPLTVAANSPLDNGV